MLHLTDLILDPDCSATLDADWFLPHTTRALLGRVAPTDLPVLCTACFGPAFARVAAAVHRASGRDELFLIDLRRNAGTIPAGLPRGPRAGQTTLALDGLEHLDGVGQDVLARELAAAPYRMVSATDVGLDTLAARWRPDLLALLGTVTVSVPALARRAAEIGSIAGQRVSSLSATLGRPAPALAPDAIAALALHPWPGDLAELDALLVRTLLDCGDLVGGADLRWALGSQDLGPAAAVARQPASGATTTVDGVAPAADLPAEPTPAPAAVASGPSAPLEALAVELAHQLKNPLVTIRTFVASVQSLCDEPHELARFRGLTDEAVSRMDEILDGLLSFSRLGATTLDRFDALLELRDALRAAWPALSAKQVTLDAPDGASLVAATDREHLRFAFATLARHVAETIEPRGTLAIAVEAGATLRFSYRESGAITHLRGVARAGEDSLPLALLLVRGALGRVGGDVRIALDGTDVSIWLRLSPP